MSCIYFDTLKHWSVFQPYLEHPEFVKCVRQNAWWTRAQEGWEEEPDSRQYLVNMKSYLELTDDETNEMNKAIELGHKHGRGSIFWWSSPHDCVENSALKMATLVELAFGHPVHILGIEIDHTRHQVVCDRHVETGTILRTSNTGQAGPDAPIIYDMIYPAHRDFSPRLDDVTIKVTSCQTKLENHQGMNYWPE